jgi:hypothetical protein
MKSKLITSLTMLIIFLVFVIQALSFGAQARTMPLLIGVPGIIFCLIQIVIDVRREYGNANGKRYFLGERPSWLDLRFGIDGHTFDFVWYATHGCRFHCSLPRKSRGRNDWCGCCFLMFYVLLSA